MTFTQLLRDTFSGLLDSIGNKLDEYGIHPNTITFLGFLGTSIGAIFLANGHLTLAGFIFLLMGPLDAIDGAVARSRGVESTFGAFLDSVVDRYSELAIYFGLIIHFSNNSEINSVILAFFALIGSIMVSYARARAEGLGVDAKNGLITRVERYLILIPCIIFRVPKIALWIVAVFGNFTVFQRILNVYRQTKT